MDLGGSRSIQTVKVWNRTDCCGERLSNFYVRVLDGSGDVLQSYSVTGQAGTPTDVPIGRSGSRVRVQMAGTESLSLAEVEIMGTP